MRVAIVGAGAMGGFYGAMLARQGYDVHFLMRSDYETVREKGLKVQSPQGDFHLETVHCYRNSDDIGPVDLAFIGLKTTHNDQYHRLIAPLIKPDTTILTAQNGLGNEELLAQLFPAQRIAGGLAFICTNRIRPGLIHHLDYGQIMIGNHLCPPDDTLRQFAQMLNQSRVPCEVVENLALARWEKLIWNVPFNGLSTLLDKTVDKIVADPDLRHLAGQLMLEVQAAARAYQLDVTDSFLRKMMDYTDKMTTYFTSMHLDARHHRPLEVESIIGEPLRRGAAKGVPMPHLRLLYEQLLALDQVHQK